MKRGVKLATEISMAEGEAVAWEENLRLAAEEVLVEAREEDGEVLVEGDKENTIPIDLDEGMELSYVLGLNADVTVLVRTEDAEGAALGEVIAQAILAVRLDDNDVAWIRKLGIRHVGRRCSGTKR